MDGTGTRRRRIGWGVGVAVVLAAVTVSPVLALVRVVGSMLPSQAPVTPTPSFGPGSSPAPGSPTSGPSTLTAHLELPGAGTAVVYAQAAAAIFRVDLASGEVVRTLTPELTQFSTFVAGPSWAVSKTVDNDSGVVVRERQQAQPLPAGLRPNGRLFPAPDGHLWLVPEDATGGYRTATRVDLDGRRVDSATIRLPDEVGLPESDLAGRLLVTNTGGSYRAGPDGVHRIATGELVAVGPRHLLTWDCDGSARCNPYRVDRASGRRTVLRRDRPAVDDVLGGDESSASSYQGVLSPDGLYAAIAATPRDGNDRPLAVVELRTGRVDVLPGSLTDTNPNAQVAWTANSRWLLGLTDGRLRAFDTEDQSVRTLDLGGGEPLQHLTSGDGPGF